MSHLTTVLAAAETHVELPMPAWVFGAIALVVFIVLLAVTWSYRDVANRHSHRSAPDAASHAGAPGATHHGSGHPTQGH
jgi:heme/copper-type cytochrome/quinol oxidase subunit 2